MKIKSCRVCGEESLLPYLDLGETPAADSFLTENDLGQVEASYPLEVCLCESCGISQLNYTVPPEVLYKYDYPYESSTTITGRTHFYGLADTIVDKLKLGASDLVIDVGSNVGVLLEGFNKHGCRTIGIEPSGNIAKKAAERGIHTINEFISVDLGERIVVDHGRASVVCITNVFAHIHDLQGFMRAIDSLLTDKGVLVIEAPHFLQLINHLEYDTIYHEHLLYVSIRPLNLLFRRHGFEVYDVEEMPIHGGTVRIYVSRLNQNEKTSAVEKIVCEEEQGGIFDFRRLKNFSDEVLDHRNKLVGLLRKLKSEGHMLAGVSAPAKGMTLLNYCGINTDLLDFISEKSALKIGRYTPGAHIPVIPDSELVSRNPDYVLLLAWNFAGEIMANLKEYREGGGKFIIPIPEPRII
jgi:SAM-dependent methyltransferase